MKTKFLLVATLLLSLQMQAQQLEKPKQLPIKGSFTNPVVSPNGTYVLLTKEHLKGVYLLNLRNNKITQISDKEGSGYAYSWNPNSNSFYYKEKGEKEYFSDAKVKTYSIHKKKSKLLEINHNFLPSYNGSKNNTVVHTNPTTLKIEATDLTTLKSWTVTNSEGQFYNAIISHDGKKVAVHNGADIYIYPIEGNGKGIKIGTGIVTSWSKDDNYLIGFLDESKDGHSVTNSDLYLFDVTSPKTIKLTATENRIEMFPCFYGDDKVMFSDDATGKIYVSDLKL